MPRTLFQGKRGTEGQQWVSREAFGQDNSLLSPEVRPVVFQSHSPPCGPRVDGTFTPEC